MIWVLVRREDTDSEGRRPREDRGRDQGGAAASPAAPAARRSWKRQEGSSPWLWRERGRAGTLISGFRPPDQEGVSVSCPARGALLQQPQEPHTADQRELRLKEGKYRPRSLGSGAARPEGPPSPVPQPRSCAALPHVHFI